MKKTYKLQDLDCANCAAKMERAIAKIKGVNEVSVSFIAQKMILDIESEEIMDEVLRVIRKVEPDCTVIM